MHEVDEARQEAEVQERLGLPSMPNKSPLLWSFYAICAWVCQPLRVTKRVSHGAGALDKALNMARGQHGQQP